MALMDKHQVLEKNATLLLAASFLVVTVGGIVEIAPLFYLENTIEKVDGMRPYSPLELAGRDIYIREGCYVCHSQMIRPFRTEQLRYRNTDTRYIDGPSRLEESMWDHPFQWGSKRTGPDLARIGTKYSESWHWDHMRDPRSTSPESVMPSYAWLFDDKASVELAKDRMQVLKRLGVPYTDEQIAAAATDYRKQAEELCRRLAEQGKADAQPDQEAVALIAYLMRLGRNLERDTTRTAAVEEK